MKLYTAAVVAQWLDISDRRVRQLRQKGVLAEVRPGLYNLKDCVHRYIEYLKKDGSAEETVDYNTERAKLARAKRKKEELDLELKRREVLQATDVEKVMVEMLLRFRQKIRNIPVKQSPVLAVETDQMEIFLALKRATDEALEELADFDGLLEEMEEGRPDGGTGESGIRRIFARLKPPPEMRMSDWADQYRRIPQGAAEPGRWRTDRVPHMREIMDSVSDVRIRKVVVMSSAQVAKTELEINTTGYYMHYDPVPILIMQPTITMAESFSKNRLTKSIQETPALRGMISDRRGAGNTILEKIFPGGSIAIVGANSPASLASRPVQVLLADEVDRYPATAGTEGDPLFLASERLTTFWNSKEVYVSTPGNKGASRIELEYQHSSQGEWNVPCPHCGELQPLTWEGVVFDKDNLDTIQYCCSKCGALATEAEWKKGFINGKYIHAEPENPVRGFHLNALGSSLARWRDIVEKFLLANEEKKKGNIEELKSWTNTKMGQTWEEEGTEIDESALMKRRERYNCEVPPEVLYLTAGVDTQDDRFEAEVVGWGVDYESWGIKYAAIYGDLKLDQVWKDLDAFLSQTFTKPDGTKLKIICACMDTGGHFTNQVYRFCKARYARGLRAIKGSNDSQSAYIQKPTKGNREGVNLFMLGVDTGKSLLLQRLLLEDEGPGYCHFPKEEGRGYDESFFIGLTAEKQVLTYKKGRPVFEWKIKDYKHKRNEALDCRNYAAAAIEIAQVPLKKAEEQPQAKKKRRKRRTSGGII